MPSLLWEIDSAIINAKKGCFDRISIVINRYNHLCMIKGRRNVGFSEVTQVYLFNIIFLPTSHSLHPVPSRLSSSPHSDSVYEPRGSCC